jgi:hypothetical protein
LDYKTSPLGDRSMILTAPVACRPCYAYKPIKCQSRECLNNINVDRVVAAAVKILTSETTPAGCFFNHRSRGTF